MGGALKPPVVGIGVDPRETDDRRAGGMFLKLNGNYAKVIQDAGGVPVLLTPFTDAETAVGMVDALLFPGGLDIDAAEYGETNHPANELQLPVRLTMERALLAAAPPKMPVLGICYGCQLLNVVRGGTLEQHTPDRVGHAAHSGGEVQTYAVETGSRLAEVAQGDDFTGKSYHHQSVGRVADGLRVTARHKDGTPEALEDPSLPFYVGVQWHPERTPDDPATRRLFRSFVDAARRFAEER